MDELIQKIIEKVRAEFEDALKTEFERGKSEGGGGGKISPEKIAAVQGLIDKYEEDEKQEAEDLKEKIKEELEKEEPEPEPTPDPEPTPEPTPEEEPTPPVDETPVDPELPPPGPMAKGKKR